MVWPSNLKLDQAGPLEVSPAKGSPACVGAVPAVELQLPHQESLMPVDAGAPNVGPGQPQCRLGLLCQLELLWWCWAQQQEANSAKCLVCQLTVAGLVLNMLAAPQPGNLSSMHHAAAS